MKAIRVHEYGGPEVMRLETVPDPVPGPGEALVRLTAAGVNFIDVRKRVGNYPFDLPGTLGEEGAGTVEALGPGADGPRVGQRVAWMMENGSYATSAVVPARALVPLPDEIDDRTAAAVMLQGLTAHSLARSAYRISAGETALVHAAAGGLGGLLTQMIVARGARVIGTVSTKAKVDRAREAGAAEVIVHEQESFPTAVRRLTGGRGVDVVYDSIGKDTFEGSLEALRPQGYLILFGKSSGAIPPVNLHMLSSAGGRFVTFATIGQHVNDRAQLLARTGELFDWIRAGALTPHVSGYPLAEAARTHELLGSRRTTGKLVLEIA